MRDTTIRAVCGLSEDYVFDPGFQNRARTFFETADQTTVLALDDNLPIGCASICYLFLMPTFDHPTGKRAHIMNVYVDGHYRRNGIASQMMTMLISEAKEKGVTEICLDATEDGRPLYEKMGFQNSTEGMVFTFS